MSVLIVDDHPSFRASARRLLEAEGFDVIGEAGDGHAAIAAAQQLQPDLVLLDVQLPDLDGFEVAARLAALGLPSAVILTSSRNCSRVRPARHRSCGARVRSQGGALGSCSHRLTISLGPR